MLKNISVTAFILHQQAAFYWTSLALYSKKTDF